MKSVEIYRLLGIGLIFLFLSQKGYTWKAVYYFPEIAKVYYDVRQDKPAHKESAYCFPENLYYPLHAGIACRGVSILHYGKPDAKQVPDSLGKQKMWHYLKVFNYPIDCRKDTTILDFSFYLEKVKKYRIYLHSTTDVWVYKDFECSFEGFQYPVQISLSAFSTSAVSRIPSIDKLFLVVNKDEEDKKGPVFIVNKFVVADRLEQEKTFLHPFWDRLFHRPVVDSVFSYMNNDPALFRNTFYRPLWNQLYLKRDKEDEEEIPLLKEVLALALQDYPFYDEKGIKKKVILEKLQELYDTQYLFSGEKQFLEALACFLQTEINDGHFFLKLPSSGEEKQLSPVRLYEIGKKIIVSAVFDSTYISQLPLGTEVLAIDGQKVEACIEDLKLAQYGVEERKRARAIALLLNRKPGDSVILTVKSRAIGEKREVKLNYPGSISIPANFRFPHALFEQKEEIAYFRIARMDGQVFLRFVNHFKEIKQSKGLILDLRGNGGGSPDGEILFSTFIQQPMVYEHMGFKDSKRRRESVVIQPHPTLRLPSDFPVVILGDENTACASEAFIQAMRQLESCWFLSHSPTAGSLHDRHAVIFPSGIFLSLDCLSEKQYSVGGKVIECVGLEPDIWVQYRKPEDLAPYNDLLKSKAVEFIQSHKRCKSLLKG